MRRGKDLQGYLLIRATDVFACTSIISVTYKRRTCIFFLNIFLFLLQRILFLTSHRRSLRNLKQNSEKLKIPFPLVSRKRKKKKKKFRSNCPSKRFENPCKRGADRNPSQQNKSLHHLPPQPSISRPPSISTRPKYFISLDRPARTNFSLPRDLPPFPWKSASIARFQLHPDVSYPFRPRLRSRQTRVERRYDSDRVETAEHCRTSIRYPALSRELGLGASLNYAAVASDVSLYLSLSWSILVPWLLPSLEARTPWGHDGGFCYSRKLVYPLHPAMATEDRFISLPA